MKLTKNLSILICASVVGGAAMTSCSIPEYPTPENFGKTGAVSATIDGTTVELEPVDAVLSSSYIRGFDASAVNDYGTGNYLDANGNVKDVFEILSSYGVNYVRLRVWNNPSSSANPSVPGASNKEVVVNQAVRAKAAGLKVLLDFHYSDFWADPGKQVIPQDWLTAADSDEMAQKVYDYTEEVLLALKEANALPNMIQIGNEINSGILVHRALDSSEKVTDASSEISGAVSKTNFKKYLAAGISAARATAPKAKIMLHYAGASNKAVSFFSGLTSLDFDVIGLSWYPAESSHGTIGTMQSTVQTLKTTHNKEVVIAETNMNWNADLNTDLSLHTANLKVDGSLYSGVLDDGKGNVAASIENQANVLRAVIEASSKGGANGVFVWGGEYKGDWKAMFAYGGKPLASMIALNVNGK